MRNTAWVVAISDTAIESRVSLVFTSESEACKHVIEKYHCNPNMMHRSVSDELTNIWWDNGIRIGVLEREVMGNTQQEEVITELHKLSDMITSVPDVVGADDIRSVKCKAVEILSNCISLLGAD